MFRRLYHVSLKIREEKLGYLPRPLDWVRPFGGITLFPVWPAFMMTTLKDVSLRAAAHVMSSSCDKDTSTGTRSYKCCSYVCIESLHLSVDKWAKTLTKHGC